MKKHIHILGASGSGTTTLAKALSEKIRYAHFDSDNYFWLQLSLHSLHRDPLTKEWSFLKMI